MKPFLLLFSLAFLSLPCASTAQAVTFTPGQKLPFTHTGKINAATNAKGDLLIWTSPKPISKREYLTSHKLHRIGRTLGDTSHADIYLELPGSARTRAFNFAYLSGKLYAFAQVVEAKKNGKVYACELNMETLSLVGEPQLIFETVSEVFKLKTFLTREEGQVCLPSITVSEDQSFLLLGFEKMDELIAFHFKLFRKDFSTIVWDKTVAPPDGVPGFVLEDVQLSNTGVVLYTGYGTLTKNGQKATGKRGDMYYYFVNTITDTVQSRLIDLGEINTVLGMRAKFVPDGHIVCSGYYIVAEAALKIKIKGVFYFAAWPDRSRRDMLVQEKLAITEKEDNGAEITELERFFVKDMVLDKEGSAWLIGQYHYGVNQKDELGNILVSRFDSSGRLTGQRLVYRRQEYRYSPHHAALPASPVIKPLAPVDGHYFKSFAAFTHNGTLHLLFLDDSSNSGTQNIEGKNNDASDMLIDVTIGVDGELVKTSVANFNESDIRPVESSLFPVQTSENTWLFICSRYEDKPIYYSGTVEVK